MTLFQLAQKRLRGTDPNGLAALGVYHDLGWLSDKEHARKRAEVLGEVTGRVASMQRRDKDVTKDLMSKNFARRIR